MANSFLDRTLGTPTNQYKYTISAWVKRSALGSNQTIFGVGDDGQNNAMLKFTSDDQIQIYDHISNTDKMNYKTNRKFRDTSAWYHIVASSDRTLGSPSTQIWVNGVQETSFASSNEYSQNDPGKFNTAVPHYVGAYTVGSQIYNGYISHFVFVDGSVVAPTAFGQTDATSGIWKFKSPSGVTFGNNGIHLKFENSGNLGLDSSGNSNNMNTNGNLKQALDTPSNVYATLNVLNIPTSNAPTFENGATATTTSSSGSGKFGGSSTLGMTTGKWYCEARAKIPGTSRSVFALSGAVSLVARNNNSFLDDTDNSIGWYSADGEVRYNNSQQYTGTSYANDDILMMAVDMDNLKVYLGKNGTWLNSGVPTSGSTGTGAITIAAAASCHDGAYFFCCSDDTSTSAVAKFEYNFGNGFFGTTAITSAGSNGNGSLFEYDVPSGYYALNTENINTYG
tara:strand:+ start:375 stop:1727 length:1353 start_codon:yes stop_codon:yes gene_type:complete